MIPDYFGILNFWGLSFKD